MHVRAYPLLAVLVCAVCSQPVWGQFQDQAFNLQSGWTSIYLEVDPAEDNADVVFVTQPPGVIDCVWTWRPSRNGNDGDCPDPPDPECEPNTHTAWRVWLPPSNPDSIVNSFRVVRGDAVYLIKASAAATLTVRGKPNTAATRWRTGFNVTGFHVDAAAPPTFDTYLEPSDAHTEPATACSTSGTPCTTSGDCPQGETCDPTGGAAVSAAIFEMDAAGQLAAVASSTNIGPGVGYWVSSAFDQEYDGPIDIDERARRGLMYGRAINEYLFGFDNLAPVSRSVTVSIAASADPPAAPPNLPANAGVIPMKYRNYDTPTGPFFDFDPFGPGSPINCALTPVDQPEASRKTLRVSVDRIAAGADALLNPNGSGAQYQSIMTINDGAGYRRWISVTAEVGNPGVVAQEDSDGGGTVSTQAGLYVGAVFVDHVNWVQADAQIVDDTDQANAFANPTITPVVDTGDTVTPRPTTTAFTFPVIVHYDGAGTYTFLKEVTLLFQPDTVDPTVGRYVLATPTCTNCDGLKGGSIVNGEPFQRRVATAAFSFDGDLALTGSFGSSLAGTVLVHESDDLNPFRHQFHPDHDGDAPGEVWSVTRTFAFSFGGCTDPGGFGFDCNANVPAPLQAGAGDSLLQGCYFETLSGDAGEAGLHKRDINLCGRFQLNRVSNIAVLNDVQ